MRRRSRAWHVSLFNKSTQYTRRFLATCCQMVVLLRHEGFIYCDGRCAAMPAPLIPLVWDVISA